MSNYLIDNYLGKYRILAPIDLSTNDFPRKPDGKIDCSDDYYIPCRKNGKPTGQIYHYGGSRLGVIVFGKLKRHNLIKACEENNILISDILFGDEEASFTFDSKDIEFIADYLGATTQGRNIRPLSIKNLPKSDYQIPSEDLDDYQQIIQIVSKDDKLLIAKLTDKFLEETIEKSLSTSVERDLRKHKMSRQKKEYIHMNGLWEEYLKYLEDRL